MFKALHHRWRTRLSAKLFAMTVIFVLLVEAVVMVPSVSKHSRDFLEDRIESAYLVALALEAPDAEIIDHQTATRLFSTANIVSVVIDRDGARYQSFAPDYAPMETDKMHAVDLTKADPLAIMANAWRSLFSHGDHLINVVGSPMRARDEHVEILIPERALRKDLAVYARNILVLSLIISTLTAAFIYWSLRRLIVKPVREITQKMATFEQAPEDPKSLMPISGRKDEIGDAQRGLHALETRLQSLLEEQRRLATLGAGISKISHDLRNILASAQLMSDRLASSDDPRVKKLSPRLISSLGRAITLSNDTLSYARMSPASLKFSSFMLADLVDEVLDDIAHIHIVTTNSVDPALEVTADKTQLYRALFNLCRNASDALAPPAIDDPADGRMRSIVISAQAQAGSTLIDIADNGPGLPPNAVEHLFDPFMGSEKPGGAGLGVAIAHEILKAHGGDTQLLKSDATGATFRLTLPKR